MHRILLPHTPRAGKMHISPATVTTLPHCETGYLAGYVCGNRTQGLLHRILLPHTPRAGKMHISPATVTTLPHCETGYLAAYVCGKTEMSFYKANKRPSLHGTVDDFFRRPNAGPLHRILLPHTPRAGKMHISPATVTTLPHCETGCLAAYVCGKSTNEPLQRKQKAFFTRNR